MKKTIYILATLLILNSCKGQEEIGERYERRF